MTGRSASDQRDEGEILSKQVLIRQDCESLSVRKPTQKNAEVQTLAGGKVAISANSTEMPRILLK